MKKSNTYNIYNGIIYLSDLEDKNYYQLYIYDDSNEYKECLNNNSVSSIKKINDIIISEYSKISGNEVSYTNVEWIETLSI